jgi:hypothetical protein
VWQSADPILGEYLPTGDKGQDKNLSGNGGVFNSFNLNLYSYSNKNPIKYFDSDGNAVFENSEKLNDAGKEAVGNKAFQPSKGITYCNQGVDFVEEKGGNSDYKGLTANQIIEKLKNTKYATEITAEQAVDYAREGITVIAGLKEKKHGHVAIVAPLDMKKSTTWGKNVPSVFNVGKKNAIMRMSGAFRKKDQPNYYVRNTDLEVKKKKTNKK